MSEFSYIMELLAKGKVNINTIKRELICPACKELFTHPLILPCQHSICHKCVKELLLALEDSFNDVGSDSSNQNSPRLRLSSPSMDRIDRINRPGWKRNSLTPRTTTFPCPGCEHDVDLGERRINETECNGERAKGETIKHFEKLFEILEERKSSVLKAIDVSKKLGLDKFQTQVDEYQGLLENNGLVEYAQELLKEMDQSYFVQTAKQLHLRVQKGTESLKSFRPAAQTSFEDYVANTCKQTEVLGELSFFSSGIDVPEINEEQSKVYNNALINGYHMEKDKADSYVLEYWKINRDEDMSWNEIQVCGTNKVVSDLEDNGHYAFQVRVYTGSICSPYSRDLILRTPPAPVFSFLFGEKCGYNEHLLLNLKKDRIESRVGFNTLLAAERIQVDYYTSLDYIIGDIGITKGNTFGPSEWSHIHTW
ncbi:E3 ubiquitin-protein ligase TRIM36 [Heterocephalus glaber]|uniref:E3 ubiquitin-protein ligase TRIM36 n=1 Tax=Heterocephalus glaber TaxID=10181 RepID=G5AM83_HETGA|nr:E3 ubiquitin-protein ligase TRIM36 [Heterocephalus glaber]